MTMIDLPPRPSARVISLAAVRAQRGLPPVQMWRDAQHQWRVGDECLAPALDGNGYVPAIITAIDRGLIGGRATIQPCIGYGAVFRSQPLDGLRLGGVPVYSRPGGCVGKRLTATTETPQ